MDYQQTALWENSIDNEKYENIELREKLKKEFIRIRENATCILAKIRDDFPSLTVHDVTRVDIRSNSYLRLEFFFFFTIVRLGEKNVHITCNAQKHIDIYAFFR